MCGSVEAARWGEIAVTAWTSSYDGSAWFVAHGDTLVMLDLIEGGPSALWAQAALGGPVIALARSSSSLAVASAVEYADDARLVADCFVFELPGLIGRAHRRQVVLPGRDLLSNGAVVADAIESDEEHVLVAPPPGGQVEAWCRRQRFRRVVLNGSPDVPFAATIDHRHLVFGDAAGRIERIDLTRRAALPSIRTTA